MNKYDLCDIKCKCCGEMTQTKQYKLELHLKKGGIVCADCRRKISSETMKRTRAKQTPKRRSEIGKKARKQSDVSKGVTKQWENFRKDPKKYAEICEAKSQRMKKVWEQYPDKKRNKIVKALVSSQGKLRSKISNQLKDAMGKNGCSGFESEKVFHGFIPDEINHELRIIVELFGDLYHCNPKKYKDPNKYLKTIQRTVGEQWQRDRRRIACFHKHGYSVIVVWEKDFRNNPDKQIKRIQNEIEKKKKIG